MEDDYIKIYKVTCGKAVGKFRPEQQSVNERTGGFCPGVGVELHKVIVPEGAEDGDHINCRTCGDEYRWRLHGVSNQSKGKRVREMRMHEVICSEAY